VTVNGGDVAGVAMQTLPGSTITGRITFEGPEIPSVRNIYLTPVPADQDLAPFVGGPGQAEVHDDWSFVIANVSGPRRLRVLSPPAGWSLKAILHNGTDITDAVMSLGTPAQSLDKVEVVLTRQQSHISGRVGEPRDTNSGCAVLAFAVDADRRGEDSRFFAATRTARDGTFSFDGLPAGDYLVAPTDRVRDEDEWRDPDLLSALERSATRVSLVEGQSVTLQLRKP
jgi:hypothetical protein